MDKQDFRSLYSTVNVGDSLKFLVVTSGNMQQGRVEAKKVGRGRGGARHLFVRTEEGLQLLSSSKSHEVQYVELSDYHSVGSLVEKVVNYNQKADPEKALALKHVFEKVLADSASNGFAQTITFNAPGNAAVHGKWDVVQGRVLRGRNGQVALELSRNDPGLMRIEVWSRRLSSVIVGARVLLTNGEVLDYGDTVGLAR